ncbi:hypothetical protein E1J29_10425 [Xanthomonas hortorum pv. vitians]|nr:hypothetical protein BI317_19890 [Xanthomonas hortorum pv. gardneri]NMI17889.1 hypothetical protein [Xanthomonas hortorum pv. vitians]QEW14332.1 hypothetical protein DYQ48_04285 [Xanthomonas hortorum]NMI25986.1 hypothetical protein [Xanthomonas hortorum pv. vitians]NMI30835.1 hypothetical protein [Xanthomonas hortorum pv. vitians]
MYQHPLTLRGNRGSLHRLGAVKSLVRRGRGALAARRTRRKYVHVGSVAASMPPHGPAIGEDTAPGSWSVVGSKPAYRYVCFGTLRSL